MQETERPDKPTIPVALIASCTFAGLGTLLGFFTSGIPNCHLVIMRGPSAGASTFGFGDVVMTALWLLFALGPIGLFMRWSKKPLQVRFAAAAGVVLGSIVLFKVAQSIVDPLGYWSEVC